MTYEKAIAFWYGRINYEVRSATPRDLKLERMRALLRALGDPQDRLRIVHITGTKGKGSTAAMIAAMLREAGYLVGLFTSPHLERVEERIQVDSQPISSAELVALITELEPVVNQLDRDGVNPTFFEISTALGFLHFVRRRVGFAIVEVGLGGRFDSTNVCQPLVSVLTSIGWDHMAQLGQTLEEIAYQKAGIIKPWVPCVSGVTTPGPREVIRRIAEQSHARLWELNRDFTVQPAPGLEFRVDVQTRRTKLTAVRVNLPGHHQSLNAAVAVAALDRLAEQGVCLAPDALRRGLERVHWPARIEILSDQPVVVLDTAHNEPSMAALIRTLTEVAPVTGKKTVIFAVSSDKPYPEMLHQLAVSFDRIFLTQYGNNPRCVPPDKLAMLLGGSSVEFQVYSRASDAWQTAMAELRSHDLLCITGSVFLAGELQPLVRSWARSQCMLGL